MLHSPLDLASFSPPSLASWRRRKMSLTPISYGGAVYGLLAEPIADSTHGVDILLRPGLLREFRSQPCDVNIDGPGLNEFLLAPDQVQQPIPAEDSSAIGGQGIEQFELRGC